MNDHHLILGTCTDLITGQELSDTHDERYRQQLARRLLEICGFDREQITPRYRHEFTMNGQRHEIVVDFMVRAGGGIGMLIRYGPGSLVTRHRPALAASRVVASYQVPVVVVTNGESADILDGLSGRVTASGIEAIPTRAELDERVLSTGFPPVDDEKRSMAHRILHAFDIHGSCTWQGGTP